MRVIPERAPSAPKVRWWIDGQTGTALASLGHGERIPLRTADRSPWVIRVGIGFLTHGQAAVEAAEAADRIVARECLRLLVRRLGIPLRYLAPRLARGRADLPLWMLGDPGWLRIVSLAERGARGLERA